MAVLLTLHADCSRRLAIADQFVEVGQGYLSLQTCEPVPDTIPFVVYW